MFGIQWKRKAIKQLQKLPQKQKVEIFEQVSKLESFPNLQNIKVLKNHKYGYRLRVGRYRVLFNAEVSIEIISIEEVKKRDGNTY